MQYFPELISERFQLRQIRSSDCDRVFQALSNPLVTSHYGLSYKSKKETHEVMSWYQRIWQDGTGLWWAISHEGMLIGACGVNSWSHVHNKAEIGYWLYPEFWRQGVMSECLPVVIEHLFQQTRLHRLEAQVESENERSKQLLLKLGFRNEGTFHECQWKNGRYISMDYFACLKSSFKLRQDDVRHPKSEMSVSELQLSKF